MEAVASPPLPAPVKGASFATSQPVVPLSTQALSTKGDKKRSSEVKR